MKPATVYRDADYDIDRDIDKTASYPEGLYEGYRLLPDFTPKIRRSSSDVDVSRYERYFHLAQDNRGKLFTWRHYLNILHDDLRHFDTLTIMSKMLLRRFNTPIGSEISNYVTASESDCSKKKTPQKPKLRKKFLTGAEVIGGDAESISSMDSNMSLTPQTNLLKKMCTELRTLARKTCKTVEKMSNKPKYCAACGDYIGNLKIHKECSQAFRATADFKPLTPDMLKGTNVARTRSMTFSMPRTPSGSGECPSDSEGSKAALSPHAVCRAKYITKLRN